MLPHWLLFAFNFFVMFEHRMMIRFYMTEVICFPIAEHAINSIQRNLIIAFFRKCSLKCIFILCIPWNCKPLHQQNSKEISHTDISRWKLNEKWSRLQIINRYQYLLTIEKTIKACTENAVFFQSNVKLAFSLHCLFTIYGFYPANWTTT